MCTYLLERDGKVVGDLSSERHNGASGVLELVDVKHTLQRELLEVKPENQYRILLVHACV
jgi:hypothetical protein